MNMELNASMHRRAHGRHPTAGVRDRPLAGPRPHPPTLRALTSGMVPSPIDDADAASSSGSRPTSMVYLERILNDTSSLRHTTPSISGGPKKSGPGRGGLALEGSYMAQVRMLEAIYSRARREAAAEPAAKAEAAPSQVPSQAGQQGSSHSRSGSSSSNRGSRSSSSSSSSSSSAAPSSKQHTPARLAEEAGLKADGHPQGKQGARAGEGTPTQSSGSAQASWSLSHHAAMRGEMFGAGAPQGAAATVETYGVRFVLDSMATATAQTLAETVKKVSPVAANHALLALGSQGRYKDVYRLAQAIMAAGCGNDHTHGAAVSALDQAGRFDMAIQYFEDMCRKGTDLGPVGSSVLIKLCAQRRDLPLALDIFYRLSGHSTLNRFSYNCLIHLCGVLGRLDDALMVLNMMRDDGGPDTKPDSYTYAALLRAVAESRSWKALPLIYREVQRSPVALDSEVWCMLITTAGRAHRPDLARKYYEACLVQGCVARHVDNALMSALSRHSTLAEMLGMYRGMLAEGFKPDEYTFNAILTTMCRVGASLYAVDDLVGEMSKWDVKINTHLGTTLINAYKRSPEMMYQDPRLTTLIMEKAHDVLTQLASQRQANSHTYGTVMAMHAQLGDAAGVQRLVERMQASGVAPDGMTFLTVAKSCEEGGLVHLAEQFLHRARLMGVKLRTEEALKPQRKGKTLFKKKKSAR